MVLVMTDPYGHLVTIGGQAVMVWTMVVYTVEVVYGPPGLVVVVKWPAEEVELKWPAEVVELK
jgi:hypothetical protein